MKGLELKIYYPLDPVLKNLINYYWVLKSDCEVSIGNRLLPVNNIDLILNFSNPIKYNNGLKESVFSGFHMTGIRKNYHTVHQAGMLDVVGISFSTTGLYPFIGIPVSEISNETIPIDYFIPTLEEKKGYLQEKKDSERILIIEKVLLQKLNARLILDRKYDKIVKDFMEKSSFIRISDYCNYAGINQKKLERFFQKYVGTSPKSFIKISRFQSITNRIFDNDFQQLTHLAYDYNYFDQTHFINDFKSLSGLTPLKILEHKSIIKNNIRKNC